MISVGYKMPYAIDCRNKADMPSFNQLYRPIERAVIGMPPLEARGHRPLRMTFDDQLKALVFFTWKSTFPGNIFFRSLTKMLLLVTTSRPKKESRKAASLRPSIPGDLRSSSTYTKISKPTLSLFYQRNMPTLGISLASTVP